MPGFFNGSILHLWFNLPENAIGSCFVFYGIAVYRLPLIVVCCRLFVYYKPGLYGSMGASCQFIFGRLYTLVLSVWFCALVTNCGRFRKLTNMKNEIKNGILVVPLEGSLVGALASEPLMNLLNSQLEAGTNKVLFNMKDMKYVDSTGLGLLLKAVSKIKQAGGSLVLCNMPEQMEKLLKMTKLEMAFNRQPDEDSALSFLAA